MEVNLHFPVGSIPVDELPIKKNLASTKQHLVQHLKPKLEKAVLTHSWLCATLTCWLSRFRSRGGENEVILFTASGFPFHVHIV